MKTSFTAKCNSAEDMRILAADLRRWRHTGLKLKTTVELFQGYKNRPKEGL